MGRKNPNALNPWRGPATKPLDALRRLPIVVAHAADLRLPILVERPALPMLRILLLLAALVPPALAQGEPNFLAGAKDSAIQLQLYLDFAAKTGNRPDFSKPPVSDLFARVFDLKQLAVLPPTQANEVSWLPQWIATANGIVKSFLYFGVNPSATPTADQVAAVKRNASDYEDQEAIALDYMIRISAREAQAVTLFFDQLPAEQRTPVRQEGLTRARNGGTEMIYGAVLTIAEGMKPANARLVSAAMSDTREMWSSFIPPQYRPQVISMIERAESATKDDTVQKDLAALSNAVTAAK
jgi:hypothetical protein